MGGRNETTRHTPCTTQPANRRQNETEQQKIPLTSRIAAATHPAIMAYRIRHPTRPGVYYMDSDDDGEAAAGGRLLKLLQLAGAEDVAVVVTRWFGGVLLGPSRFALINNVARALLVREGFIAAPAAAAAAAGGGKEGGGGGGKKKKGR